MQDSPTTPTDPQEGPADFDLTYAYDDDADPRTITIYPRGRGDVTTTWITMDVEFAVDRLDVA